MLLFGQHEPHNPWVFFEMMNQYQLFFYKKKTCVFIFEEINLINQWLVGGLGPGGLDS